MISGTALFIGLFNNLAILIVLIAIYGILYGLLEKSRYSSAARQMVIGLFFGIVTITCMNVKIPVAEGVIVDQRNAIVILSGIFGGPIAALLCALMAGAYRWYLGGIGVLGGCLGLGLSAAAGVCLHLLRPRLDTVWKAAMGALAATVFILPGFLPIGDLQAGWNLMKAMALPYGGAIFLGVFLTGLLLDREERRHLIERQLIRSEKQYRELYESLVDVSYRTGLDGIITIISPSCEKMFGFRPEELIGRPITDFYKTPSLRDYFLEHLRDNGHIDNYEVEIRKKDGTFVWVSTNARMLLDDKGNYSGVEGVTRDISLIKKTQDEKTHLEESMRQIRKMESIGTLAGGIAHDFNNILAAIIGYAEMALQKLDPAHPVSQDIAGILRSGMRAKELVRHILIFSRKSSYEAVPVEIHLALKEALRLLRASIPTTVDIKESMKYRLGKVLADPTEIHQVIMNLCTNAAQAMEETGGVMSISLEKVTLSADALPQEPALQPGAYVVLEISDTGPGIPKEIIDRIFDPFFTTKDIGKGTGMGLAVVHGIVGRLGGTVTVESTPGNGATFSVYLPEAGNAQQPAAPEETVPPKGHERILLVDDEPIIVEVTRRRLELLGYRVTSFTKSEDALASFRSQPEAFDCIITDQAMPKMTGEQLSTAILAVCPDIPIILCTGYSAVIDENRARETGIRAFAMKPLDHRRLAEIVRNVLDGVATNCSDAMA